MASNLQIIAFVLFKTRCRTKKENMVKFISVRVRELPKRYGEYCSSRQYNGSVFSNSESCNQQVLTTQEEHTISTNSNNSFTSPLYLNLDSSTEYIISRKTKLGFIIISTN